MLIRGQKTRGYIEINENLRFMQHVAMRYALPWSQAFFVDGVTGSDTRNAGRTPTRGFATVGKAIAAGSRGDIIYIRPLAPSAAAGFDRYVESVTIPYAKNDLSIIGITNSLIPDFGPKMRYATEGGYIIHNLAEALHVENIGFLRGGTSEGCVKLWNDGAGNIKRGTDGTTFYNCYFKYGIGILTKDGGDGTTIVNCSFVNGARIVSTNSVNPGRRMQIRDCRFLADNGVAPANSYIYIYCPMTDALIVDSYFDLKPSDGSWINANTTTNTGLIANCHFAEADAAPGTEVNGGGMKIVGCYDETGLLA